MSTRLYSFKTLRVDKLINLLADEGHTNRMLAKAIGCTVSTISKWKNGNSRPGTRIESDKIVDYSMRHLTKAELESVEIYP